MENKKKNKPNLIVIAGCAASGKTTIARHLAKLMNAAYVDKDDATRRFTDLVLKLHGLPPYDRESEFYVNQVRDTEYDTMFAIAKGNLELGNDVVVSAPFLNVIGAASKWREMRYPVSNPEYDVTMIWISHDLETEHARMIERAAIRDGNKLRHWDEYAEDVRNLAPDSAYNAIIIDNPDDRPPYETAKNIYEMLRRGNATS